MTKAHRPFHSFFVYCTVLCLGAALQRYVFGQAPGAGELALYSGLALATLFVWGLRPLYTIFVISSATILYNIGLSAEGLAYAALMSFCIGLQSAAIYLSYRQFEGRKTLFQTHTNFGVYCAITLIACLLSSMLMMINHSAFVSHDLPSGTQVIDRFMSNITAVLLLTPALALILSKKISRYLRTPSLELAAWVVLFGVLGGYALIYPSSGLILLTPLLIWSAARFSQTSCALAIALCCLLFVTSISTNSADPSIGSWFQQFQTSSTWLLLSLACLYLNTLMAEKERTEHKLEDLVHQKVLDLSLANQELKDEIFIREQAEKAQRTTSKRYRALIETAGIPIIVLDQNACIRQWNRAAENTFGCSREHILGKNFIDNFIIEEQQDEMAWKLTRIMESGINRENVESTVRCYDGNLQTMLWNINHLPNTYEGVGEKNFLLIGQNISDIRKTQDQLHFLAHFDSLTGCANRRLFEDRCSQAIQSAIRHKHSIALIGLDIDHFKRINDTLGHDAGDEFLVEMSKRLGECVRREDTIARLGGDEFAVLLANVHGQEGAEIVARNMLEAITRPIYLKGSELIITSSIGITICPADGTHYPDLLKNADMAMYRAKSAGRNNIQFYSPEMNEEMQRQLLIEQELRSALKEKQFHLYYQPIIDIESGAIVAVEALLRWQHPHRGLVRPSYFLQVAEQTGLLHEIGSWALRQTCIEGLEIQKNASFPLQIALNISSRQYNHPNLVSMISEITKETGFDPRDLILEMSESTITSNTERSISILQELNTLGLSLTIDGFGTGLSSLRQIKQIPIDIIKIDRTFVDGIPEDENDMTIAETLLTVASHMNLKTFATGVETKEQEAFLKINGCRYAQGYLYSAPLPLDKLSELFTSIQEGDTLRAGHQIYLPFDSNKLH